MVQGPIAKMNLLDLKERDSDDDLMDENEFPYMSGRMKEIDFRAVIEQEEPWSDPYFPHGKYALFVDHKAPMNKEDPAKQLWMNGFHWKRASEYFGQDNFKIFEGVDPSDTIMGACNNCYAFAALTGLAEALEEEKNLKDEDKG